MANLNVVDLLSNANENRINSFTNHIDSELKVATDYDRVECNYEWLEIMEDSIKYIDNILRNPNRFIVNEEDIIKIELAKRIGVESIKHLSRNTNLIQDYNKKTGDVRPSKILNISKEESFDTYENRFIFSLIENMKLYIARKKSSAILESKLKNNKKFEYVGSTSVGKENINIHLNLDTKLQTNLNANNNEISISDRIDKLELRVKDLCSSKVYIDLAKKHISLVTSPIKKTNVILKNTNFQYALKLWNYMQEHVEDDTSRVKSAKSYNDDGKLKQYLDETFLLDYLIADSLDNEKKSSIEKEKITEKLVGNMVQKIIDINTDMTEEELKKIVTRQFTVIKYKSVVSDKEIVKIFREKMDKYFAKIDNRVIF